MRPVSAFSSIKDTLADTRRPRMLRDLRKGVIGVPNLLEPLTILENLEVPVDDGFDIVES